MASGLRAGGVPVKETVPLIDDAAVATPGQTDITTAASHNLFPVTRMLDSLVIAKPRFSSPSNAAFSSLERVGQRLYVYLKGTLSLSLKSGRFYHRVLLESSTPRLLLLSRRVTWSVQHAAGHRA
jgi:hypothetical protein